MYTLDNGEILGRAAAGEEVGGGGKGRGRGGNVAFCLFSLPGDGRERLI